MVKQYKFEKIIIEKAERRYVWDNKIIIEIKNMHQNSEHLLKIYGDPRGSPGDLSKIRYGMVWYSMVCRSVMVVVMVSSGSSLFVDCQWLMPKK